MASVQRRRGRPITFWQVHETVDARGNLVVVADPDTKIETTAAVIPVRSSMAEVNGQVEIDVVRVLIAPDLENVTLWSRAELDGEEWDVMTPSALHWGQRHNRHWSIDLRQRPRKSG